MISEVIILRNGLHVFHRSYGEFDIESLDITSGLFEAIFQFSSVYAEDQLESINMVESIYHFQANGGFIFILRQMRGSIITKEQIKSYLDQISQNFHELYPDAINWDGTIDFFDSFTLTCDSILHASPARMGIPFLLKISLKPFLIAPMTQILAIDQEDQDFFLELQFYLNKYFDNLNNRAKKKILSNHFLIYLHNNQKLVFIKPFFVSETKKDFVYFLTFMCDEKYWFTFYMLISLIKKRANIITPVLMDYIPKLELNPTSDANKRFRKKMQDDIYKWANLNQYVGTVQANLFEEFFKTRTGGFTLTESDARMRLLIILNKFEKDIDKLIFALLGQKKLVIVGYEQTEVQQTVNALISFFPHPSAITWAEKATDALLVGTSPDIVKDYDKTDLLIVDLDNGNIIGGEKNKFCEELMKETQTLLQDISLHEGRRYFQGKVSSVFSILKTVLRSYVEEEEEALKNIIHHSPVSVAKLIERMCIGLNPLLADFIHKQI